MKEDEEGNGSDGISMGNREEKIWKGLEKESMAV